MNTVPITAGMKHDVTASCFKNPTDSADLLTANRSSGLCRECERWHTVLSRSLHLVEDKPGNLHRVIPHSDAGNYGGYPTNPGSTNIALSVFSRSMPGYIQ